MNYRLLFPLVFALVLSACGGEQARRPEPVATQVSVLRSAYATLTAEVPAATTTPEPIPTPRPSATASPTATATPTATAALADLVMSKVRYQWGDVRSVPYCSLHTTAELVVWVRNLGEGDAAPFVVYANGVEQEVDAGLVGGGSIALRFDAATPPELRCQLRDPFSEEYQHCMLAEPRHTTVLVDAASQVKETDERNNLFDGIACLPTAVATCTASPSPTPTVTDTPTPTATPSPTLPARQLTKLGGLNYDPVWSPDGLRIAFVGTETGGDEIWVINADGSNPVALTRNTWEWDKHPTWSPDGTRIAFWSNRNGVMQIYVMDANGRNLHNISNTEWNEYDPIWVKDWGIGASAGSGTTLTDPTSARTLPVSYATGVPSPTPSPELPSYRGKIIFLSEDPEAPGLWVMDPDGGNRVNHAPDHEYYRDPMLRVMREQERFSPDGRFRVDAEMVGEGAQIFVLGPLPP